VVGAPHEVPLMHPCSGGVTSLRTTILAGGTQSPSSLESAPRIRSFVPARRRASSPYLGTAAGASSIGNAIRVVLDADSSELLDWLRAVYARRPPTPARSPSTHRKGHLPSRHITPSALLRSRRCDYAQRV
jgi:hypothetical protein